jgi:flagellar basal-body rod modification protein FlgD
MQISSYTSGGAAAAAAATTTTGATSKSSALGQADFLKLLAKQFQTQDPMKPMDDTSFIAQMAQFTSLEQSSSLLSQITTLNGKQDIATANSYLGRIVTVSDGRGGLASGEATGVQVTDGVPRLMVGGTAYPVSAVVGVTPKPVPAPAVSTAP